MIDDETHAWQEIAKTIKPLKGKKKVVPSSPPLKKLVVRERAGMDFLDIPVKQSSPLPQKRVKQLKQQKIPVEAHLDLHGMTLERAHKAVSNFIINAYKQDYRCIEIVTGIGRMEGTGQLKRFFPLWVNETELKKLVLHIEVNPISRGGSYLVLLRRNKVRD